eukprot:TRINITY_DN65536_c0_g1_i1.p1 TRINITY_DN65536_c0_g1~~TRINITY_DN65536_c0_g1_i1.p1  ORF type:complete len:162 (+),score=26.19 TRINITY_DN65536_c0_g1_i1:53-538(+)
MIAWKETPRRFVEPPLVTAADVKAFQQLVATEIKTAKAHSKQSRERFGSEMEKNNSYFNYFKKAGNAKVSPGRIFGYDRICDDNTFSQSTTRDTMYPKFTQAARKSCKVGLETSRQIRTSQAYGWGAPIDEPAYGLGKTTVVHDSFMDKSHLKTGGPWTAR